MGSYYFVIIACEIMMSCETVAGRKSSVFFGWKIFVHQVLYSVSSKMENFQIRTSALLPQGFILLWNLTAWFGIFKMLICCIFVKCLCFGHSLLPETAFTHLRSLVWGFAFRCRKEQKFDTVTNYWCSDSCESLCGL